MWPRSTILLRRRLVMPSMTTMTPSNNTTLLDQGRFCIGVGVGVGSGSFPWSLLQGNNLMSWTRGYVSRAHPSPIPEFAVPRALQMVLEGIEERKIQRVQRWERSQPRRQAKGIEVSSIEK
jgi:hypothetical protein